MSDRDANMESYLHTFREANQSLMLELTQRVRDLDERCRKFGDIILRLVGESRSLMINDRNTVVVKKKIAEIETRMADFARLQDQYQVLLLSQKDKEDALRYRIKLDREITALKEDFAACQREKQTKYVDDIAPEDSASAVSSRSSSVVSARLKIAAERAALEAETELLKAQEELEEQEFRIKQKQRSLELSKKLARASAIEKTFASAQEYEADRLGLATSTPIVRPTDPKVPVQMTTPELKPTTQNQEDVSSKNTTSCPPITNLSQNPIETAMTSLIEVLNSSQQQQRTMVESLQLPKAELMTFDGDPLTYWVFMRAFETTVEKESISDAAKLSRLIQYTSGKTRALIQGCAARDPTQGYQQAKFLLEQRFGNRFDISSAWTTKILSRPNITESDKLRYFADDLRNCFETLSALNELQEISNRGTLVKITEKLPRHLQTRWLTRVYYMKSIEQRIPTFNDLLNFVVSAAEEANDSCFGRLLHKKEKNIKERKPQQRSVFLSKVEKSDKHQEGSKYKESPRKPRYPPCPMCDGQHALFSCDKFRSLTSYERFAFARDNRLRFKCLRREDHLAKDCPSTYVCTVDGCGQHHSKFLHMSHKNNDENPETPKKDDDSNKKADESNKKSKKSGFYTTATSCQAIGAGDGKTALPIVPVKVRGRGEMAEMKVYALLDSGSTQSFCSEELKRELGLAGKRESLSLTTLDGNKVSTDTELIDLEISDVNDEARLTAPRVMTRPQLNISREQIASRQDTQKWPHLRDLGMADSQAEKVHLLIGQDVPAALVPREVREGGPSAPYAVITALGWALNGPVRLGDSKMTTQFVETDPQADTDPQEDLQHQVEAMWKLDNAEADDQEMSVNDKRVLAMWDGKTTKHDGKHYSLDIPLKNRPPQLPDNKPMAEQRLRLLKRRLDKDTDLKEKYLGGMSELLQKGYAEPVPPSEEYNKPGESWYLPHHPVTHPRKSKIRIVFDCAAKFQNLSLNSQVLQGPDLTNKLIGVLLRFKEEEVAFTADIKEMFNQVKVNQQDRDVLRFLWYTDEDLTEVRTYRMTTHLFGGVWSPSCVSYTLKRTARDSAETYSPLCVLTVDHNFYVDDCLKSVATEEIAKKLIVELRKLLSEGGFRLTKWSCTSREVQKSIPEAEWAEGLQSLDLDEQMMPCIRALGVLWAPEEDMFKYEVNITSKPLTKRGLLSVASSIYDPLGYASPFTLVAKMLFQRLCEMKFDWDQPMPQEIILQWNRWLEDLPRLSGLSVPRCVKPRNFGVVTSSRLHHFSDASEKGFGAASYLRQENQLGEVHVILLMAKAKLAPLKSMTIPRLELTAAVESVKLDRIIRQNVEMSLEPSTYWTDSTIVLGYLSNEDKRYRTFVANRVSRILGHSSVNQWKHVPTADNPADDVSRGQTAAELINNTRWLKGPDFLQKDEEFWPKQPDIIGLPEDAETKTTVPVYHTDGKIENQTDGDVMNDIIRKHSDWYKLKKSIAWILRLRQVLQSRAGKTKLTTSGPILVKELRQAEEEVIRYVQRTALGKLENYRRLNPKISEAGIVCVGGRLDKAPLTQTSKHPMILPNNHSVVDMIVSSYHKQAGHCGVEQTLAGIRERFWIVKGRAAVKRTVVKCNPL